MKEKDYAYPKSGKMGQDGLTKRELFAIQIYAGMSTIPDNMSSRKQSARLAVECADALIKALEEK